MRRVLLALAVVAAFLVFHPALGLGEAATPQAEHGEQTTSDDHGEAGDHEGGGHASPVTPVLLGLVIMLLAAKLGGEVAERVHQPAVLGELIAGVILGNLVLFWAPTRASRSSPRSVSCFCCSRLGSSPTCAR